MYVLYMAPNIEMTGRKFGHLTVIRFHQIRSKRESARNRRSFLWWCRCDCGNELAVLGDSLRSGNTVSCRCLHGIRIDNPVTWDQLRQLLRYDKATGDWWWKVPTRKNKVGDRAGVDNSHGYLVVTLGGRTYGLHVLAWFYVKKVWPKEEVDHRDRDPSNNRWRNLREATHQQNLVNTNIKRGNATGYRGVQKTKSGRFRAYFQNKYIGVYDTPVEAAKARDLVATRQFGAYAYTNF